MAKAGTQRQKRVARKLVDNLRLDKPLSAGEVLKSVGYGTGLQNQPKRVLESEGVKTELAALGFNEENAKRVVGEILDDVTIEPQHRIRAAEQVFKVTGAYAPEKSVNLNVEAKLLKSDPIIEKARSDFDEVYRQRLIEDMKERGA